jgi:uncharacterized coiled-coil protein SlyX
MKINLEIMSSAYLIGEQTIEALNTKELVPKMVFRRRLTQASKLVIELMHKVDFTQGRIMYGSAYGELEATSNILHAIVDNNGLSPTDFQNSVYNTAASYASILHENQNEIMTISSGDETGEKLLKLGAIKALDGDEILLIATETMNIKNIQDINQCIDYLECAVAFKVKVTQENPTLEISKDNSISRLPKSMALLIEIAKKVNPNKLNILSVVL